MSPPRMLHAGTTYMVTRTTTNRWHLLVPSEFVNAVIRYCIALAKRGLRIEVHSICVESNHLHLVITDYATDLPAFMRELCRALAKCMLAYYRELKPETTVETLWSAGSYSAVALTTPEAVVEKIAYVLTNPVKDGLVPDYRDWPGVSTQPHHWSLPPKVVQRPQVYFSQKHDELEQLPLEVTVPPMLRDRPLEVAISQVETRVRDVETTHREARERSGKRFLGQESVLRMDPFDAPHSAREPGDVNPQLASGGDGETMSSAQKLLKEFRASYRDAWGKFKAGVAACFPAGTYLVRVRLRVRCDQFTPPWCVAALECGA